MPCWVWKYYFPSAQGQASHTSSSSWFGHWAQAFLQCRFVLVISARSWLTRPLYFTSPYLSSYFYSNTGVPTPLVCAWGRVKCLYRVNVYRCRLPIWMVDPYNWHQPSAWGCVYYRRPGDPCSKGDHQRIHAAARATVINCFSEFLLLDYELK